MLSPLNVSRKLKYYFEAHPIVIFTDQPLKLILSKSNVTGRVTKCVMEIAGYNLEIRPRTTKKGKVLADFLNEYTTIGIEHLEKEVEEAKSK